MESTKIRIFGQAGSSAGSATGTGSTSRGATARAHGDGTQQRESDVPDGLGSVAKTVAAQPERQPGERRLVSAIH